MDRLNYFNAQERFVEKKLLYRQHGWQSSEEMRGYMNDCIWGYDDSEDPNITVAVFKRTFSQAPPHIIKEVVDKFYRAKTVGVKSNL